MILENSGDNEKVSVSFFTSAYLYLIGLSSKSSAFLIKCGKNCPLKANVFKYDDFPIEKVQRLPMSGGF